MISAKLYIMLWIAGREFEGLGGIKGNIIQKGNKGRSYQ